jgi:hypothetical protein
MHAPPVGRQPLSIATRTPRSIAAAFTPHASGRTLAARPGPPVAEGTRRGDRNGRIGSFDECPKKATKTCGIVPWFIIVAWRYPAWPMVSFFAIHNL